MQSISCTFIPVLFQENFDLRGARIMSGQRHGLDRESVESATLYLVVKDTRAGPGTHQTATGKS